MGADNDASWISPIYSTSQIFEKLETQVCVRLNQNKPDNSLCLKDAVQWQFLEVLEHPFKFKCWFRASTKL